MQEKNSLYTPIPIYEPRIVKVNNNSYIKIQLYEKKNLKYYDIIFSDNGIEKFIGRFDTDIDNLNVIYKNGKILVYNDKYIPKYNTVNIVNVLALYDILDGVTVACTQEEALKLFDKNINYTCLVNPNQSIIRSDIEKKLRLKYK